MATANIEEELTCSICLELYKDPRLLPCHHSICKSCLIALRSKQENDSDTWLHCPSCRHLFEAKDEAHIESLPKNFTLASIVCKFRESVKGDNVFECDVCEDDKKGRAIKKCLQCQLNYCRVCLEHLHPKTGVLASHKLVHIIDAYGAEHKEEEFSPTFQPSVSEIQSVDTLNCDRLKRERYCMSCDEICTEGDQSSIDGIHEHHVTTELRSAVKQKREEVKYILARLLDEDRGLAKGVADLTSLIDTIRKKVEGKKIELVQRFGELTDEVERRKLTAENRMEEEMKRCITSLECRLYELEDDKAKTKTKIAEVSELSSLTKEDARQFLIKVKELQNEIEPITEDHIQRATTETECDLLLRSEQLMNEIISDATCDICPSERRLLVRGTNICHIIHHRFVNKFPYSDLADIDTASEHVPMEIHVTSFQLEGTVSADVEWVATQSVDHYEVSYFCDPREIILQRGIAENRCRLSTIKCDSEYTVRVTACLSNGKSSFDSATFKTDPKVKVQKRINIGLLYFDTKPAIIDIPPRRVKMAIKVTTIQKAGTMSADVKWTAKYEPCEYEVFYYCNPDEIVVLKNIAENRCMLTNLRWDSTYTVKVTTALQDGTSVFNEKIFKTDLQVKCIQMAVSMVYNKKIEMLNSCNEFKASNRINQGVVYQRLGKFSGIVLTPALVEDVQFWTMNIELSIFEEGANNQIYFDFGIIPNISLEHCYTLRYNRAAYSCSVIQKKGGPIHLVFNNCSISVGNSYVLPLELCQRAHFCYGFLYNFLNDQFAVVDCLSQDVLHVFNHAEFSYIRPIFAVCPYHTETKMRVKIKLDHEHATNEDVSSWMQKISQF
ncbi:hypothetical protein ACJMK2_031827 [Sinanodonta woodiana]|uniref:Uncharacterized protein n=1 Tax=Sinanodonta woodiana TaxID=1069815 RepID=A0ABD3X3H2_SINWO